MAEGCAVVYEVAREMGATLEPVQTSLDFRRVLLRRGAEAVVVDLVRERVTQRLPEKLVISGIRVDPPEEILANKLCTLLSRSEVRDWILVRSNWLVTG
jgi:hypothetical protein